MMIAQRQLEPASVLRLRSRAQGVNRRVERL
jgi:hypothetical protein